MAEIDTTPLPGPASGVPVPAPAEIADVHGEDVLVTRGPVEEYPDDAEMIREKLQDQKVVMTPSGEYSLDEAGELVFAPYPGLGSRR